MDEVLPLHLQYWCQEEEDLKQSDSSSWKRKSNKKMSLDFFSLSYEIPHSAIFVTFKFTRNQKKNY